MVEYHKHFCLMPNTLHFMVLKGYVYTYTQQKKSIAGLQMARQKHVTQDNLKRLSKTLKVPLKKDCVIF